MLESSGPPPPAPELLALIFTSLAAPPCRNSLHCKKLHHIKHIIVHITLEYQYHAIPAYQKALSWYWFLHTSGECTYMYIETDFSLACKISGHSYTNTCHAYSMHMHAQNATQTQTHLKTTSTCGHNATQQCHSLKCRLNGRPTHVATMQCPPNNATQLQTHS